MPPPTPPTSPPTQPTLTPPITPLPTTPTQHHQPATINTTSTTNNNATTNNTNTTTTNNNIIWIPKNVVPKRTFSTRHFALFFSVLGILRKHKLDNSHPTPSQSTKGGGVIATYPLITDVKRPKTCIQSAKSHNLCFVHLVLTLFNY